MNSNDLSDFSKTEYLNIVDATKEEVWKALEGGHGGEILYVKESDIKALLDGKMWAFPVNGGEYTHFVILREKQHDVATVCLWLGIGAEHRQRVLQKLGVPEPEQYINLSWNTLPTYLRVAFTKFVETDAEFVKSTL